MPFMKDLMYLLIVSICMECSIESNPLKNFSSFPVGTWNFMKNFVMNTHQPHLLMIAEQNLMNLKYSIVTGFFVSTIMDIRG
jgi:hypothetical protein